MFRLIKLAAYCLLGYFIYQMYQGVSQEQQQGQSGRGSGRGGGAGQCGSSRRQRSTGGAPNVTGGGSGQRVQIDEPDGGTGSAVVGRGVIGA